MRRETLLDFFADFDSKRGEFLVHDDGFRVRRFTYQQTAAAARAFAGKLQSHGIGKADKILFWSENRPEWIVALWGCLLNGSIAVPIDYRASPRFLSSVRRIVDARLLLVGDDVDVTGIHSAAAAGSAAEVQPHPAPLEWRLSELEWHDSVPFTPVAAAPDDTAEIIFTSGATAEPKGVVLTHRNVLANIVPVEREVAKYRPYGRPFFPLRFLNLLPLSHMFGQSMATFVPPMLAGTVVFIRGFNPQDIVGQIHRRRVSVLVSVPKILDVLSDHAARLDPAVRDAPAVKSSLWKRWWRYRRVHRAFG